jgi:hypothetical protein
MKKYLFLLLFSTNALASTEAYNNNIYCSAMRGQQEYKLENRVRVDCLTDKYAIEMDWANKWYEGITQSLYYAMKTGKQAKLVLIMKSNDDAKYVTRAKETVDFYQLPVELELLKDIKISSSSF